MAGSARLAIAAALAMVIAFTLAACNTVNAPPLGPVPDAEMSLTANNQSDRTLELFINGGKIADVAAGTAPVFQAKDLPPLPWTADLRLPTGRTLLSLTITSGSVVRTETGSQAVGTRVDLSCGRIELWAVIPLGGPPPGEGRPGDCGP